MAESTSRTSQKSRPPLPSQTVQDQPLPRPEENAGERGEGGPVQRPTATWWQLLEPCSLPESHAGQMSSWETTAADLGYLWASRTLSPSSNGLRPHGEPRELSNTQVARTSLEGGGRTALPALRGAPAHLAAVGELPGQATAVQHGRRHAGSPQAGLPTARAAEVFNPSSGRTRVPRRPLPSAPPRERPRWAAD